MKIVAVLAAVAMLFAPAGAASARMERNPGKSTPAASPQKSGAAQALTGVDKIHDQVRIGSKVCMADHEHKGAGEMPSRKGAEGAAIRAWQIFTRDEYGSAWGNYQLAVAKTMQCKDGGGRWTCNLSARPCRPAKI